MTKKGEEGMRWEGKGLLGEVVVRKGCDKGKWSGRRGGRKAVTMGNRRRWQVVTKGKR